MLLARTTLLLISALLGLVPVSAQASDVAFGEAGTCGTTSCCCEAPADLPGAVLETADACPCTEPAPPPSERHDQTPAPPSVSPESPEAEAGEVVAVPSPTPRTIAPSTHAAPVPPPRVLHGVRLL
jgi:hypothetical protein